MKIALVVPGGVDRSGEDRVIPRLLWLIERLAIRHDVHVFATSQEPAPGAWDLLGARVHNIGTARGTALRLIARVGTEHRAKAFDVVHAFFGPCGAYAALVGWRFRIPVLFHPSGGEFVALAESHYGMRRTMSGRLAMRVAAFGADRVTVASAPMQALAAAHGIAAECVPLGVALDRWPRQEPAPRDTAQPARLLHVGDVRGVKDQQTLIAAAGRLNRSGVPFELDCVGLGTDGAPFRRMVEAEKIEHITRFHGTLRREPLRELFQQTHLLLVSSRHEAGPLVVLEAAVAGAPTVGTAVGHIAEWAPHAAVAVPIGDHVALARETGSLLADEPRRLELAREAQRRATEFDADYSAARFEAIYHALGAAR